MKNFQKLLGLSSLTFIIIVIDSIMEPAPGTQNVSQSPVVSSSSFDRDLSFNSITVADINLVINPLHVIVKIYFR